MELFVSYTQIDDTDSTERELIDALDATARKHGFKVSCHGDAESTLKLLTKFEEFKTDLNARLAQR